MSKDTNQKSSSGIKRSTGSSNNIRLDSDDFSTSMARLAELAAQGIKTEEKEDKNAKAEEEALKQYLTPKRKKESDNDKSEESGSVKFRVNPYVLTGIMVVLLSVGFLAIPNIVKLLDDKPSKEKSEQRAKAQQSAKEDKKMSEYSLGDAIKDVQKSGELKTASISDLAQHINEINTDVNIKKDTQGWFSLLSTDHSIQLSGDGSEPESSVDEAGANQDIEAAIDEYFTENTPSDGTESFFNSIETEFILPVSFSSQMVCPTAWEVYDDISDALFFQDVMRSIWREGFLRAESVCTPQI